MRILLTGAAGFIGMHVAERLLRRGDQVVGLDNLNDYYDVQLKKDRVARLAESANFRFCLVDIVDWRAVEAIFIRFKFDRVIHLAAQAGVRHSLVDPWAYTKSNIEGFLNILEGCRKVSIPHLTYASTSSVYGSHTSMPFSESDSASHPLALYGATKRANELMAHSYSHLYGIPTTGLRFFTVYGPWGRPDMALFLFTRRILRDEPIELFNYGDHTRDFTYVDDIAEGVVRVCDQPAGPCKDWDSDDPDPGQSDAPFRILNIGNSRPVPLRSYVNAIEKAIGRRAKVQELPMQAGDVPDTFADVSRIEEQVGYRPSTPIETGVRRFVEWYRDYYRE